MNPEFKKNMWLNFSKQKLFLAPIVVLLIFYISYELSLVGGVLNISTLAKSIYLTSSTIILILGYWGLILASDSVTEEVRENTWIFLKSSALDAWSFTWGKLLGSCSFCWYCTLLCLPFLIVSGLEIFSPFLLVKNCLIILLTVLLVEGLGILMSINKVTNTLDRKTSKASFIWYAFAAVSLANPYLTIIGALEVKTPMKTVMWYSWNIEFIDFVLASLFCFTAWILTGSYRLFRRELQYSSYPWVWLSFLCYLLIYSNGFINSSIFTEYIWQIRSIFSAWFFITFSFIILLTEKISFNKLRMLFKEFNPLKLVFARDLPIWICTATFTLILVLVNLLLYYLTPEVKFSYAKASLDLQWGWHTTLYFLSFIRDALIIILISLSYATHKSQNRALLFYMVLIYGILPTFFSLVGIPLLAILPFYPSGNLYLNYISVGLWICLLFYLVNRKYMGLVSKQVS